MALARRTGCLGSARRELVGATVTARGPAPDCRCPRATSPAPGAAPGSLPARSAGPSSAQPYSASETEAICTDGSASSVCRMRSAAARYRCLPSAFLTSSRTARVTSCVRASAICPAAATAAAWCWSWSTNSAMIYDVFRKILGGSVLVGTGTTAPAPHPPRRRTPPSARRSLPARRAEGRRQARGRYSPQRRTGRAP